MKREPNSNPEQELTADQSIIRYLLNELRGRERAIFEERYFADVRLFERMRAIEEELIEDYVRGELSETQRARFEEHYLSTAERREKVRFAARVRSTGPVIHVRYPW